MPPSSEGVSVVAEYTCMMVCRCNASNIPPQINLYRGYLAICHPEEEHLKLVEKLVEAATVLCIREWKRLPHIVSHIHLPYLQAAQQVPLTVAHLEDVNHSLILLYLSLPLCFQWHSRWCRFDI